MKNIHGQTQYSSEQCALLAHHGASILFQSRFQGWTSDGMGKIGIMERLAVLYETNRFFFSKMSSSMWKWLLEVKMKEDLGLLEVAICWDVSRNLSIFW